MKINYSQYFQRHFRLLYNYFKVWNFKLIRNKLIQICLTINFNPNQVTVLHLHPPVCIHEFRGQVHYLTSQIQYQFSVPIFF